MANIFSPDGSSLFEEDDGGYEFENLRPHHKIEYILLNTRNPKNTITERSSLVQRLYPLFETIARDLDFCCLIKACAYLPNFLNGSVYYMDIPLHKHLLSQLPSIVSLLFRTALESPHPYQNVLLAAVAIQSSILPLLQQLFLGGYQEHMYCTINALIAISAALCGAPIPSPSTFRSNHFASSPSLLASSSLFSGTPEFELYRYYPKTFHSLCVSLWRIIECELLLSDRHRSTISACACAVGILPMLQLNQSQWPDAPQRVLRLVTLLTGSTGLLSDEEKNRIARPPPFPDALDTPPGHSCSGAIPERVVAISQETHSSSLPERMYPGVNSFSKGYPLDVHRHPIHQPKQIEQALLQNTESAMHFTAGIAGATAGASASSESTSSVAAGAGTGANSNASGRGLPSKRSKFRVNKLLPPPENTSPASSLDSSRMASDAYFRNAASTGSPSRNSSYFSSSTISSVTDGREMRTSEATVSNANIGNGVGYGGTSHPAFHPSPYTAAIQGQSAFLGGEHGSMEQRGASIAPPLQCLCKPETLTDAYAHLQLTEEDLLDCTCSCCPLCSILQSTRMLVSSTIMHGWKLGAPMEDPLTPILADSVEHYLLPQPKLSPTPALDSLLYALRLPWIDSYDTPNVLRHMFPNSIATFPQTIPVNLYLPGSNEMDDDDRLSYQLVTWPMGGSSLPPRKPGGTLYFDLSLDEFSSRLSQAIAAHSPRPVSNPHSPLSPISPQQQQNSSHDAAVNSGTNANIGVSSAGSTFESNDPARAEIPSLYPSTSPYFPYYDSIRLGQGGHDDLESYFQACPITAQIAITTSRLWNCFAPVVNSILLPLWELFSSPIPLQEPMSNRRKSLSKYSMQTLLNTASFRSTEPPETTLTTQQRWILPGCPLPPAETSGSTTSPPPKAVQLSLPTQISTSLLLLHSLYTRVVSSPPSKSSFRLLPNTPLISGSWREETHHHPLLDLPRMTKPAHSIALAPFPSLSSLSTQQIVDILKASQTQSQKTLQTHAGFSDFWMRFVIHHVHQAEEIVAADEMELESVTPEGLVVSFVSGGLSLPLPSLIQHYLPFFVQRLVASSALRISLVAQALLPLLIAMLLPTLEIQAWKGCLTSRGTQPTPDSSLSVAKHGKNRGAAMDIMDFLPLPADTHDTPAKPHPEYGYKPYNSLFSGVEALMQSYTAMCFGEEPSALQAFPPPFSSDVAPPMQLYPTQSHLVHHTGYARNTLFRVLTDLGRISWDSESLPIVAVWWYDFEEDMQPLGAKTQETQESNSKERRVVFCPARILERSTFATYHQWGQALPTASRPSSNASPSRSGSIAAPSSPVGSDEKAPVTTEVKGEMNKEVLLPTVCTCCSPILYAPALILLWKALRLLKLLPSINGRSSESSGFASTLTPILTPKSRADSALNITLDPVTPRDSSSSSTTSSASSQTAPTSPYPFLFPPALLQFLARTLFPEQFPPADEGEASKTHDGIPTEPQAAVPLSSLPCPILEAPKPNLPPKSLDVLTQEQQLRACRVHTAAKHLPVLAHALLNNLSDTLSLYLAHPSTDATPAAVPSATYPQTAQVVVQTLLHRLQHLHSLFWGLLSFESGRVDPLQVRNPTIATYPSTPAVPGQYHNIADAASSSSDALYPLPAISQLPIEILHTLLVGADNILTLVLRALQLVAQLPPQGQNPAVPPSRLYSRFLSLFAFLAAEGVRRVERRSTELSAHRETPRHSFFRTPTASLPGARSHLEDVVSEDKDNGGDKKGAPSSGNGASAGQRNSWAHGMGASAAAAGTAKAGKPRVLRRVPTLTCYPYFSSPLAEAVAQSAISLMTRVLRLYNPATAHNPSSTSDVSSTYTNAIPCPSSLVPETAPAPTTLRGMLFGMFQVAGFFIPPEIIPTVPQVQTPVQTPSSPKDANGLPIPLAVSPVLRIKAGPLTPLSVKSPTGCNSPSSTGFPSRLTPIRVGTGGDTGDSQSKEKSSAKEAFDARDDSHFTGIAETDVKDDEEDEIGKGEDEEKPDKDSDEEEEDVEHTIPPAYVVLHNMGWRARKHLAEEIVPLVPHLSPYELCMVVLPLALTCLKDPLPEVAEAGAALLFRTVQLISRWITPASNTSNTATAGKPPLPSPDSSITSQLLLPPAHLSLRPFHLSAIDTSGLDADSDASLTPTSPVPPLPLLSPTFSPHAPGASATPGGTLTSAQSPLQKFIHKFRQKPFSPSLPSQAQPSALGAHLPPLALDMTRSPLAAGVSVTSPSPDASSTGSAEKSTTPGSGFLRRKNKGTGAWSATASPSMGPSSSPFAIASPSLLHDIGAASPLFQPPGVATLTVETELVDAEVDPSIMNDSCAWLDMFHSIFASPNENASPSTSLSPTASIRRVSLVLGSSASSSVTLPKEYSEVAHKAFNRLLSSAFPTATVEPLNDEELHTIALTMLSLLFSSLYTMTGLPQDVFIFLSATRGSSVPNQSAPSTSTETFTRSPPVEEVPTTPGSPSLPLPTSPMPGPVGEIQVSSPAVQPAPSSPLAPKTPATPPFATPETERPRSIPRDMAPREMIKVLDTSFSEYTQDRSVHLQKQAFFQLCSALLKGLPALTRLSPSSISTPSHSNRVFTSLQSNNPTPTAATPHPSGIVSPTFLPSVSAASASLNSPALGPNSPIYTLSSTPNATSPAFSKTPGDTFTLSDSRSPAATGNDGEKGNRAHQPGQSIVQKALDITTHVVGFTVEKALLCNRSHFTSLLPILGLACLLPPGELTTSTYSLNASVQLEALELLLQLPPFTLAPKSRAVFECIAVGTFNSDIEPIATPFYDIIAKFPPGTIPKIDFDDEWTEPVAILAPYQAFVSDQLSYLNAQLKSSILERYFQEAQHFSSANADATSGKSTATPTASNSSSVHALILPQATFFHSLSDVHISTYTLTPSGTLSFSNDTFSKSSTPDEIPLSFRLFLRSLYSPPTLLRSQNLTRLLQATQQLRAAFYPQNPHYTTHGGVAAPLGPLAAPVQRGIRTLGDIAAMMPMESSLRERMRWPRGDSETPIWPLPLHVAPSRLAALQPLFLQLPSNYRLWLQNALQKDPALTPASESDPPSVLDILRNSTGSSGGGGAPGNGGKKQPPKTVGKPATGGTQRPNATSPSSGTLTSPSSSSSYSSTHAVPPSYPDERMDSLLPLLHFSALPIRGSDYAVLPGATPLSGSRSLRSGALSACSLLGSTLASTGSTDDGSNTVGFFSVCLSVLLFRMALEAPLHSPVQPLAHAFFQSQPPLVREYFRQILAPHLTLDSVAEQQQSRGSLLATASVPSLSVLLRSLSRASLYSTIAFTSVSGATASFIGPEIASVTPQGKTETPTKAQVIGQQGTPEFGAPEYSPMVVIQQKPLPPSNRGKQGSPASTSPPHGAAGSNRQPPPPPLSVQKKGMFKPRTKSLIRTIGRLAVLNKQVREEKQRESESEIKPVVHLETKRIEMGPLEMKFRRNSKVMPVLVTEIPPSASQQEKYVPISGTGTSNQNDSVSSPSSAGSSSTTTPATLSNASSVAESPNAVSPTASVPVDIQEITQTVTRENSNLTAKSVPAAMTDITIISHEQVRESNHNAKTEPVQTPSPSKNIAPSTPTLGTSSSPVKVSHVSTTPAAHIAPTTPPSSVNVTPPSKPEPIRVPVSVTPFSKVPSNLPLHKPKAPDSPPPPGSASSALGMTPARTAQASISYAPATLSVSAAIQKFNAIAESSSDSGKYPLPQSLANSPTRSFSLWSRNKNKGHSIAAVVPLSLVNSEPQASMAKTNVLPTEPNNRHANTARQVQNGRQSSNVDGHGPTLGSSSTRNSTALNEVQLPNEPESVSVASLKVKSGLEK